MDHQPSAVEATSRSERKRQAIIQAATEVFLRHGYLGATTDEVAARASVSKQTLYKHFADKERLYAEVILGASAGVSDALSNAAASTLQDVPDVRKALRALADSFLSVLLQPDYVRLRRLIIAEADRFPDVGTAWFEGTFDRTLVILGEAMQRLADRGLLRNLSDPTRAAYQFADWLAEVRDDGDPGLLTPEERTRYPYTVKPSKGRRK